MAGRISVGEKGGPEVLRYESFTPGEPGPGEVRVRHAAIGLNFIDVYLRTGLYPPPGYPFTPGFEAAGVIEALGEGVSDLRVGQRVAYGTGPAGAYATHRVMPAAVLVPIPDTIADETAAAIMLKGMTAQYLLRQTHRVEPGETVLIHAAAGGVGQIATQWAKHLGATVIGTVGGAEKIAFARAHGCDHVIDYTAEDLVARVKEITAGKGVPVVYDGVGKATFMASLDCLRPRGLMVSFGNASGPVEPFAPTLLAQKGSLYLTRPTLFSYTATRAELLACAQELLEVVAAGVVRIEVNQRYELAQAAQAHRDLEARRTTGASVLLP